MLSMMDFFVCFRVDSSNIFRRFGILCVFDIFILSKYISLSRSFFLLTWMN